MRTAWAQILQRSMEDENTGFEIERMTDFPTNAVAFPLCIDIGAHLELCGIDERQVTVMSYCGGSVVF